MAVLGQKVIASWTRVAKGRGLGCVCVVYARILCVQVCFSPSLVLLMNQLSFGFLVTDRQTQRQAQSWVGKGGWKGGSWSFWGTARSGALKEMNSLPNHGVGREEPLHHPVSFLFASSAMFHFIGGGESKG